MPQTTSVKIVAHEQTSISGELVPQLLSALGGELTERGCLVDQRGRILRNLDSEEIQDPSPLLTRGRWTLLKTKDVPLRVADFIEQYKTENEASLLPSRFFGETSILLGPHKIEGEALGAKKTRPFVSWVSVSFYCEETPSDWAGFEAEFRNSSATHRLLHDLRVVVPNFELSIRYFF